MPKRAPKIKLSNGQEMPMIGLGTLNSNEDTEKAVGAAIKFGYRLIDTALDYKNEEAVGKAIKAKISKHTIKREDIFVVTKLGAIYHDPDLVEHSCRLSLKNLDLDYIDLYLIDFPIGQVDTSDPNVYSLTKLSDVDFLHTWRAMEKLVDAGLVRSIGLSNFNAEQTERVLENCRIKPVVNQVECSPYINQKKLIEFSKQRNIFIMAYCPLARPFINRRFPDFIFSNSAKEMAEKYKKTPAQVCLRYVIQNGAIPIPKSVNPKRIAENFEVFDFEVSAEDMKILDGYSLGDRRSDYSHMRYHKNYPFNTEF